MAIAAWVAVSFCTSNILQEWITKKALKRFPPPKTACLIGLDIKLSPCFSSISLSASSTEEAVSLSSD